MAITKSLPPVLTIEKTLQDKYRPQMLKDMFGQEKAQRIVAGMLKSGKIPQTILITAESGTGKTTLARIIARKLDPTGENTFESNASKDTGIDAIRDTIETARFKPMSGSFKVYIIDEAHGLTAKAGSAALAFLEAPPEHVVVILATDQDHRMLKTLRDRAKKISLQPLDSAAIKKVLLRVAEGENIFQPVEDYDAVFTALSRIFTGSARPAIDALCDLSLIAATRPLNKGDISNEINKILQFDYKSAPRFVNLWYKGDKSAVKLLANMEDAPAFCTLLCSIHDYLIRKAIGLEPVFDYLGVAAAKGLEGLSVKLLNENMTILLELRAALNWPQGRKETHLLLNGLLKLKGKNDAIP